MSKAHLLVTCDFLGTQTQDSHSTKTALPMSATNTTTMSVDQIPSLCSSCIIATTAAPADDKSATDGARMGHAPSPATEVASTDEVWWYSRAWTPLIITRMALIMIGHDS